MMASFFAGGKLLARNVTVSLSDELMNAQSISVRCDNLEIKKTISGTSEKKFHFYVSHESSCDFSLMFIDKILRKEIYVQPGFSLFLSTNGEKLIVDLR